MTRLYLTIIFISMIFIANFCYCLTVEEYMSPKNIGGEEPIFTEDKTVITADDGTSVVLRTLNPYYAEKLRSQIRFYHISGRTPEQRRHSIFQTFDDNTRQDVLKEYFYFLLCEDETHILLMFDADKDYPQEQKDNLTLVKYGDFNTLTVHNFSYTSKNDKLIEAKVWIDKENDKFCGTYTYKYMSFSTDKEVTDDGRNYYNFMRDFFISEIEKELQRCNDIFANNVDYEINRNIFYGNYAFRDYDKEMEERFAAELETLLKNEGKFRRELNLNLWWLQNHSMTVSEIQQQYKLLKMDTDLAYTRPDIVGNLPRTDEELEKYLAWRTKNFVGEKVLKDRQGTPIKFEIDPLGLKAISAGPDREFGTDDDVIYINTGSARQNERINGFVGYRI